ncbi:MAG: class I adenylate-forming enzyme family protein [Microthrixaceae bacterium]
MLINPVNLARRASLALRRDATLADLADRLGSMHGDAVVVEELPDGGAARQITHRQAAATVARWSAAVAARSPVGRPVVVATPNTFDQLLISLAVSRAGGLPAPVNSQMSAVEVDHVIADSGATLVIRDAAELDTGPGSRTEPRSPHRAAPGDVAALFYTSGTTGRPKGAELTHRALVGQVSSAALWPGYLRHDRVLLSLPVAHIMGFVALLGVSVAGVPVVFLPRFSAARALDLIEERRISAFVGVPAMYRMLLEAGAEQRDLSSVRAWMSGADVMPAELARQFKAMGASATLPLIGAVGEAAFIEGYGMVEVGGGVAAKVSPPMLPVGLGDSLGLPLPGWRFRVADAEGRTVLPGQVGELQLKGPGVLKGYWGDPAATQAALSDDGWLRTGDLVRSGALGTVMFQGRSKHVIKSGGYTVYPLEIEADLEEHPDVLEAAVVGLSDAKLGEVPVAAVRLRSRAKVTPEGLVAWAEERMAHYKAPRRVIVVDDLPRTGTRKVQRDQLVHLFD